VREEEGEEEGEDGHKTESFVVCLGFAVGVYCG